MTRRIEEVLEEARTRITRVEPSDLSDVLASGGLVVDIRPEAQRSSEGALPGAIVIERNVLEWRLDPRGDHRIPQVHGYDQQVVVVCSAGYASSLAAASLADHPLVGEAKGVGLIAGIELVADKANKKNFDPAKGVAQKLSSLAEAEGLIVRPLPSDRIALCPPAIIEPHSAEPGWIPSPR